MKLLLDIKDSKVDFIMELLSNFKFVKAEPLTDSKTQLKSEIKEAVENLKQVREGKMKAQSAEELLDDL